MTTEREAWTVMKLLQTSAKYLGEKGSGSPRLDAELLLGKVLGVPRIKLYTEFDKPVIDGERDQLRELVRRRATGEPVAYILGEKEFYGRPFKVDKRVLVPRPETELAVDAVRRRFAKDRPLRIVDFGVGSGALAVTLALEFPASEVLATDISAEALAVAEANAAALGATNVKFAQGDWLEPVRGQTFDLAVSNPPYIAAGDPEVEPGVHLHEPHGALYAGATGLEAVTALAGGLGALLSPSGVWICEFGAGQRDAIAALLAERGWKTSFENDLAGIPRIFTAERV